MNLAAPIAVEIDRIVTGIYSRVAPRHRERLARGVIADVGLEHVGALPAFNAELAAGPVDPAFIDLRVQYDDLDVVHEQISNMTEEGFLEQRGGLVHATERITPVLHALMDARDETAIWAVGDNNDLVDRLNDTSRRLSTDASAELLDYTRHLPEPDHPSARLPNRLMKVRYIRFQCHTDAWRRAGLEAPLMRAFTALWNDEQVEPSEQVAELVSRGLANDESSLTDAGRALRDQIEHDTNECAQAALDRVLTGEEQQAFLADLTALELAD